MATVNNQMIGDIGDLVAKFNKNTGGIAGEIIGSPNALDKIGVVDGEVFVNGPIDGAKFVTGQYNGIPVRTVNYLDDDKVYIVPKDDRPLEVKYEPITIQLNDNNLLGRETYITNDWWTRDPYIDRFNYFTQVTMTGTIEGYDWKINDDFTYNEIPTVEQEPEPEPEEINEEDFLDILNAAC